MPHGNPSPASLAGVVRARAGRAKKGMSLHQSSAAEPFRLPSNIFALMLCSTALVRHSTNREGLRAIHPQRTCNLAARLLHKTPNQQDMSFSRMQDAEHPHRPPRAN